MSQEHALLYWEDFTVGSVEEYGDHLVTEADIIRFASEFDPQPFHLDPIAAETSLFKGLCASGWHTCAIAMRIMCDNYLLKSHSLGSPGMDSIRWLKPVRPNDRLHLRVTVLEARVMESRPKVGLVRTRWQMFNQADEEVILMEGHGMFRRRPA